jgi:hypothetical protein
VTAVNPEFWGQDTKLKNDAARKLRIRDLKKYGHQEGRTKPGNSFQEKIDFQNDQNLLYKELSLIKTPY